MLIERINNWFTHAKKYFFNYKDGFYQVYYLANSPESTVKSLFKMPFLKHDAARQKFTSNSPFFSGNFYYQELEEGLWLNYSDADFKQPVSFKLVYDKFIPSNYYMLSYNINVSPLGNGTTILNNVNCENKSWGLFKPKESILSCHFKGCKVVSIIVYFSEEWFAKNLQQHLKDAVADFFTGDNHYIVWPDNNPLPDAAVKKIMAKIHSREEGIKPNLFALKNDVLSLIECFTDIYKREEIAFNHYELPNADRIRILKIEKYLEQHLGGKFEGIDSLAKKFNVSPTKLKNDFKLVFGKPVYQYFQQLQMQLAGELLHNEDVRIKELTARFGYENTGKFSQAFKKHFHVLPSKYVKEVSS